MYSAIKMTHSKTGLFLLPSWEQDSGDKTGGETGSKMGVRQGARRATW